MTDGMPERQTHGLSVEAFEGGNGGTRRRIEDAALDLFFERGFRATTMREIAVAAALTPGAIYNHFPSKEALLAALIRDVHDELERALHAASREAGDDPRDQLAAWVRVHALFHTRYRKHARVANQEIYSLPEPDRTDRIEALRRMRAAFRATIERGVAAGVFRVPEVEVATFAIINMGIRIAEWFHPEGRLGATEVADVHAALALRMLGATEAR